MNSTNKHRIDAASHLDRTRLNDSDIYTDVVPACRERVGRSSSRLRNLSIYRVALHLQLLRFLPAKKRRTWAVPVGLTLVLAISVLSFLEIISPWLQAHTLADIARSLQFSLAEGPSSAIHYPHTGPYDYRLGYASLPRFTSRLEASGYKIAEQARDSNAYMLLTGLGLYPVYRETNQAGLQILDGAGQPIYTVHYPARIYSNASEIPPLLVNTLLFIENRDLLDVSHPYLNPAVEWGRLSRALMQYSVHQVDHDVPRIGGSTLATQLEKIRHSPRGKTHSVGEKFWQMASASLRAYRNGPQTLTARRDLLCDYINSIPLAALPNQGEVTGLGDGLWVWYGADFATVNRLLEAPEKSLGGKSRSQRALAYRETLSLLLAMRAPYYYLVQNPKSLSRQTERYLRALRAGGIISAQLDDLAMRQRTPLRPQIRARETGDFVANKVPDLIRAQLLPLLGLNDVETLDHLDLTVRTTVDSMVENNVTQFLRQLTDPGKVEGLQQHQLLDRGDPSLLIYAVTLYEREKGANVLRVQADNYDEPLSINNGTKLQLGSTAKLRTLIEYLQIVERLHQQYAALSAEQLKEVSVQPQDSLTQWAVQYLSSAPSRSLESMLEAALDRQYSASPHEGFFTAGGLHYFNNFEPSDNDQILTVSQAFQQSVNLVFIRLMRDIERYYVLAPGGAGRPEDMGPQLRQSYLSRFADEEGKLFLGRFYEQFRGHTPDQVLSMLLQGISLTPLRLAVIYRSVRPQAKLGEFSVFMSSHLTSELLRQQDLKNFYEKYGADKFNLADRGYLSHTHPLKLWLVGYLEQHPRATLSDIFRASAQQRQEVYWWLFRSRDRAAQDVRIKSVVEEQAFQEIWRDWRAVGYPFESLVPSYATAVGVSGDTPSALAGLMGIILNDGVRQPTITIRGLHFARATPVETVFVRQIQPSQRVLSPEIARIVRMQLIGVVENGTGRRVHGGLTLADGTVLPIGGKTGTGDNRFKVFDKSRSLVDSRAVNRTATFVFMIGDRFFGTVIAFMPGKASANYGFTSALAVQVLKDLEPWLKPLLQRTEGGSRRQG